MRRISRDERRARLVARHHLARPADSPRAVAAALVGLHASDPATVFLSCWSRLPGFAVDDLEADLYERRDLLRVLGMRRTVFVTPVDLAAILNAACANALAATERRRLLRIIEKHRLAPEPQSWLAQLERATLAALRESEGATAAELTDRVPDLGRSFEVGVGKRWGGTNRISTQVLFLLAAEAKIVRGRPGGTWRSTQYRWAPTETWIEGGLPSLDVDAARGELLARWLRAYGPGTFDDLHWWSGWGKRDTAAALARLDISEVDLDGRTGIVLADDLGAPTPTPPSISLLPGLDPSVMGWKERGWFLGEHGAALFDRNGNAGATVWADGRIVGGWAQRASGEIATRLLEDVGSERTRQIESEAARLASWLGDVRVLTRFPAPLDKELRA